MNSPKTFLTVAGFGLLITIPNLSGQSGKSPTPVRASVGEVTDTRSTGSFFSECKVELKFTGDAAADAGTVREVQITEALDELGRDLKPSTAEDAAVRSFGTSRSGGTLKTEVKLKNPSRNATTIRVLKGQVELFNPTEENGAIIRIKDVLKHPAEPIQNPALSRYGILLMYLTKEAYDAKKKELAAANSNAAGNQLGEAFGDLFKGMFSGMMSGSRGSRQLYNKAPQKRIFEM